MAGLVLGQDISDPHIDTIAKNFFGGESRLATSLLEPKGGTTDPHIDTVAKNFFGAESSSATGANTAMSRSLGEEQAEQKQGSTPEIDNGGLVKFIVQFLAQSLGLSSAVTPHLEAGINGATVSAAPSHGDVMQVAGQQVEKVAGLNQELLKEALQLGRNNVKAGVSADAVHANQNTVKAQVVGTQQQAGGHLLA